MDRPGEGSVVTHAEKDSWTIKVVEKENWIADGETDDDEAAEKAGNATPAEASNPGDGPGTTTTPNCDSVAVVSP